MKAGFASFCAIYMHGYGSICTNASTAVGLRASPVHFGARAAVVGLRLHARGGAGRGASALAWRVEVCARAWQQQEGILNRGASAAERSWAFMGNTVIRINQHARSCFHVTC